MSGPERKIVAIGGGECGRVDGGEKLPYELGEIDREVVRLSGREKPHFLFLGHAMVTIGSEAETQYADTMRSIYADLYGCEFRSLRSSYLTDGPSAAEALAWADIVYEGGGDTVAMLSLWRRTGFDALLRGAWESGKVMCGVSAGAICWFALGNTDSDGYREREVNRVEGLGFVDAYFSPHCQLDWKRKSEVGSLKHIHKVGLSVSNCSAVEIIGDRYRILTSTPADDSFRPYVLRSFWREGVLSEEEILPSDGFRDLRELLAL